MAATRTERDEDLVDGDEPSAWDERPIFGESRGLPWWGAILLALLATALGAAVDLKLNEKTTLLFQATYFIACVAAVCGVRRRNLFGPMVQPPLILAAVLIGLELAENGLPKSFELKEFLLSYGIPVINGFPTMAVTTGATLAIGLFRLFWQRDPHDEAADDPLDDKPRAKRPTPARAERTQLTAARTQAAAARAERTQLTPQRRPSAATNRARPLDGDPPQRDSAPRARPRTTDSGPHPRPRATDTGPRPRPAEGTPKARPRVPGTGQRPIPRDSGTLSPRPTPASRRQPPPARPWESAEPPATGRRRLPPKAGEQPPPRTTPPRTPRGDAADPPPRRSTDRRPPPRSRRWDRDDRS